MKKDKREKFKSEIERNEKVFREFFDEYYSLNKSIKTIGYRTMEDGDGFSAVIDWGKFIQYVNYYCDAYDDQVINACFELEAEGHKFICHFDDILDELMSEDLSFYTYAKCLDETGVKTALNEVMKATENYFESICEIAVSQEKSKSVFCELFDDAQEVDDEDIPRYPEEAFDFNYFLNGIVTEPHELKKELERNNRKNKLETKFEKRAYQVLSKESTRELKSEGRKRNKAREYPFKYRFLAAVPYVVFAIVLFILFYFLGYKLDELMFNNCFGRGHIEAALAFSSIGAVFGLLVGHLMRYRVSKALFKKNFELIETIYNAQMRGEAIIIAVLLLIIAGLMFTAGFGGIAFKGENIAIKDYGFSQLKEYSFNDVEIARITGYENDINDEYAFKTDGDWQQYIATDNSVVEFIETKIKENNKEVKEYQDFEDID
ncbi:MAG: hypothetical protein IJ731_07820 [Eubacterium sp.]|nr:hypothetical protein [Eubacterium sp.]